MGAAAFGTLVLLALLTPRSRRPLLAATALAAGVWLAAVGPLYEVMGVRRLKGQSLLPIVHHIAAHVASGTPLTADERSYIDSLRPLEKGWPYTWNEVKPIAFSEDFNWGALESSPPRLVRTAWALFRRNPLVDLRHFLASSALVWRVALPEEEYRYNVHLSVTDGSLPTTIDPNPFGLAPHHVAPALTARVTRWVLASERMRAAWVFWSPAFALYLAVAGVAIAASRLRSPRFLLALLPVGLHSAFVMVILPCQHFRYQYPASLVGGLVGGVLLLWPILDALERFRRRAAGTVDTPSVGC